MKLGKEKKQIYYVMPAEFSPEEVKNLKEYALKNIINDEQALINYAVVDILKKYIDKEEVKNNKKGIKNASKSKR